MVFNLSLGLDFSNPGTSGQVGVRMAVFRDFVELALEWKKPLILHVRQATVEAIQIMTEVGIRYTLHCWVSRHWQGFESKNLGSSPGLLGQ